MDILLQNQGQLKASRGVTAMLLHVEEVLQKQMSKDDE
jgi:hypothetical protein